MAIKITPAGEAKRAAQAGKIIGEYRAATEAARAAEEKQKFLQNLAAEKEMAQFRHQLAIDEAKFRLGLEVEARKRAATWDLEKMEIRSRMDFEKEEAARLKKEQEYEAGVRIINERFPEGSAVKADALYQLQMKTQVGFIPREAVTEKPIFTAANIQRGLGELTTGAPTSVLGMPLEVLDTKEDFIKHATTLWGPNWKDIVPEAVDLINTKFPGEKEMTQLIIDSYVLAAGGNIEKAKKQAEQDGYKVD
jgi:hypothetical protein